MPTFPTNSQPDIRIALVDDDPNVRLGLSKLIDESDGFICVGKYVNCESALEMIVEDDPDVLLLDIELPGMSGSQGVLLLKEKLPQLEVLMLTHHEENDNVFESLSNGASGYLLKNESHDKLLQAIREVRDGGSPMSMNIARMVTQSFQRKPPPEPLSRREQEVLDKLQKGHSYQAIADVLFISKSTVKFHIKNIYRKLQVANRVEAISRR